MTPVGILQGRLSPAPAGRAQAFPWHTWRDEFAIARACGADAIEWLVTAACIDANPIWSERGVRDLQQASAAAGVSVPSVCADFLIERPIVRTAPGERRERIAMLTRLIAQADCAGARVVLLPLLEDNRLTGDEDAGALLQALDGPLSVAARLRLHVAIESDWPADRLRRLIGGAGQPALAVYYDIGNAVTFGFDAAADITALGSLIHGVHVKDRRRGGGSVALGSGDADMAAAFDALAGSGYAGPVILETPPGDDPIASARHNLAVARRHASRLNPAGR